MNDQQNSEVSLPDSKITLSGAVSMGTGVMIGAGVFALMSQVAGTAGRWFPFAFLAAAAVAGITSYSYVKLSNTLPSAGNSAVNTVENVMAIVKIGGLGAFAVLVAGGETLYMRRFSDADESTDDHEGAKS